MRKVAVGLLGASLATGLAVRSPPRRAAAHTAGTLRPTPNPRRSPTTISPTRSRRSAASCGRRRSARSSAASQAAQKQRQHGRQGRQDQGARGQGPRRQAKSGATKTQDQYVELQPRDDRPDLRDPGRVRQRAAPVLPGPGHRPEHRRPGPLRRSAAQRDPGSPTGRWTTRPSGRPDYTAGPLPPAVLRHRPGRRVAQAVLRDPVLRPLHASTAGHRLGQGPVQRGPVRPFRRRPTPAATQRLHNVWDAGPRRRQPVGRRPEGRRAGPTRRSRRTCSRSTSGTGTTTTATATSTSRTATSTTSRSSTPAATRPTVTRSRVRTPSGATAGTRTPPTSGRTGPAEQPARRHPDRQHRHLDRRLHDPAGERRPERLLPRVRPRPGPAGRLRHLGGGDNNNEHWTLMAQSRLGAKNDGGIGDAAATSARGTSSSSAGSTTRWSWPGRSAPWTSARRSTTPPRRRPRWWCCRSGSTRSTTARRSRAPSSSSPATTTT